MKLTRKNMELKLGMTNKEEMDIILNYQKELPILSQDGEGFCVNARDLHKELAVGRDYSTWIKGRILKYDFIENQDYTVGWYKDNIKFDDDKSGDVNANKMVRNGYKIEYKITIEMAKQLAMVQNNERGKIARRYFIVVEKALKEALKWEKVRKPERERYKEMCQELEKYMIRNLNKTPMNYDYMNEANALNKICLGANAKSIREYIGQQDKNTREWLEIKYNEYLDKMQELNIMYMKMNLDKNRRYDLIRQGFKALYPNSSFLILENK